jgi:hypothetical protein
MDHQRAAAEHLRPWDRAVVTYPVFALIAAVGGLFASFTFGALVLVLALGGTMLWLGITGRAGRRAAPRRVPRGAAWWSVPIVFIALVELFAFSRNSPNFPTISLLAEPFLAHYLARSAVYFGWLVTFWGLVRR